MGSYSTYNEGQDEILWLNELRLKALDELNKCELWVEYCNVMKPGVPGTVMKWTAYHEYLARKVPKLPQYPQYMYAANQYWRALTRMIRTHGELPER